MGTDPEIRQDTVRAVYFQTAQNGLDILEIAVNHTDTRIAGKQGFEV